MPSHASAFAVLGLEPGADLDAIERAYKRLIKEHHPDRAGGDAARAAEIIRAYRELRAERGRDSLEFHDEESEPQRRRRWSLLMLAVAVPTALALAFAGPAVQQPQPVSSPSRARAAAAADPMTRPLTGGAISRAIVDARQMSHAADEMRLVEVSRRCHDELRRQPSLEQLDRCAAFDDTVALLQDRDPLRDRGPFSQLAVTGRQWSAASTLSNDYLAIDSRLDRIRLQVELALAPQPPPPVVANQGADDEGS